MFKTHLSFKILFLVALIACCNSSFSAQEPISSPPVNNEEILKIDTNLIQTGVTVINKSGQFVNDLKLQDFEVRVDGKPVTPNFFDKVTERRQNSKVAANSNTAVVERGRTLVFLVDDVHLGAESTSRVKKLITKFLDEEMLDEDSVAIISSSGKVGFLQQFTSDKSVLRAALERIKYTRNFSAGGDDEPPMTENEAQAIDRLDKGTFDRFVQMTQAAKKIRPNEAASLVNFRAQSVLAFARAVTQKTFALLEESMNKTRALPGRKAIFFISDGFLLDPNNTTIVSQLNKLTNAATRSNTVIYSFDARGLDAGEPRSAAESMSSSSFMMSSSERYERQDGLSYLSYKTGGRFIRNTNDLQSNLTSVSAEAFTYYLLAWEPETEIEASEKLKNIEITVKGRPELIVLVNSGYLNESGKPAEASAKQLTAEQKLIATTDSLVPKREIPVALAANYLDMAGDGATLSATLQIDSNSVEFTKESAVAKAELEIIGLIYNSSGKVEKTFKVPLKLNVETSRLTQSGRPPFYYEYQTSLKPDLYQMRIAVRDTVSGRIGNASQWLEIPDISSRKMHLSSLLIGERKTTDVVEKTAASGENQAPLRLSVDRRFDNNSSLRFFGFIYNANGKDKSNASNVTIQTQILQQGKIVRTDKAQLIESKEKDPAPLIYGGEIALKDLPLGRYELKVIVNNPATKANATKSVNIVIK